MSKKNTKKQLKLLDYHDYISDAGLDGLKVLEGHKKTEKVLNKETGEYEVTGLYGIKESAIKEVKRYAKEQGYDITEEMKKVKTPWDLTEKTARDFAGYYAWRNYNFANKYTDNNFANLNQHQKDVLLSYFHNMAIEKLNKNRGSSGSMLDAIEIGDTDEIMKRMFMKPDGSYGTYEDAIKRDRRGLMNRYMATAQWFYNPYAEVVSSFDAKDRMYRDDYTMPGKLDTILRGIESMQDVRKKYRNMDFDNYDSLMPQTEQAEQAIPEPKQPQQRTFWQTLGDVARAITNPMFGMAKNAESNNIANMRENMLNNENGEQK